MKPYGGMEIWPQAFLISLLDRNVWSNTLPGRLNPAKIPRHPLDRRPSGTQSRFGRYFPYRESNLDSSVIQDHNYNIFIYFNKDAKYIPSEKISNRYFMNLF
jgi:hypothetical protein